jgi:hypothetical protein
MISKLPTLPKLRSFHFFILAGLLCASATSGAAIPSAEKILPQDTLVLVTVPDYTKLREGYNASPQKQFWNDPAMKPFKEKFLTKWREDFVKPLERELNVHWDDYTNLLSGQLTLAITQGDTQQSDHQDVGLLMMLDTKNKSAQIKTNLADLQKKWTDAGKTIKTEKIRGLDFYVVSLSSNDVPQTLRKFFPQKTPTQELPDSKPKKSPKSELVVGQFESMLIVGSSVKVVEKTLIPLTGGSFPALADLAIYDANHQSLFRDTPIYAWINLKAFVDLFQKKPEQKPDADSADPTSGISPEKVLAATGISGLKTLAFTYRNLPEGALMQFFIGVPDSGRQGIFKILAGEPKETTPPPFIPAEAIKFQRWRIDGQKTWATLEKMLADISPQWSGGLEFLLSTATAAAKEKDPSFDVRKNLIGNLGDDFVSYEKAPRGSTLDELKSPPSLFLIGSPNPEQLAAALKNIFVLMSQQSGKATEREFLGRKIFTVPLPQLPGMASESSRSATPRMLNYAAGTAYLAISTDASLLEEYLRSSENKGKTLRETEGLNEATQRVVGPGTSLYGFENLADTMRIAFDIMKKDPTFGTTPSGFSSLPGVPAVPGSGKGFRDWLDFSLLPPFEKISKYFYFTVYGAGASVDGLTLKMFVPVPPQIKQASAK